MAVETLPHQGFNGASSTKKSFNTAPSTFDVYLFGPPRLHVDGRVLNAGLRKAMALLAYLVVEARPQSRDSLAAMLWPETAQREARASLRRTLYRLQKLLGAGRFDVNADYIEVDVGRVVADVHAFERAAAVVPAQIAASPGETLPVIEQAVATYGAGFMTGFNLPDSPTFDAWQTYQREQYGLYYDKLLATLADWHAENASFDRALDFARRRLTLDLANEAAHRQLMTLYAGAGRRSAALRQFESCARSLREVLGEDPSAETVALLAALRNSPALPVRLAAPTRSAS